MIDLIRRRWRALRRLGRCGVCDDDGVVAAPWALARDRHCTCGRGAGELVMHDQGCDILPCPFCQLTSDPGMKDERRDGAARRTAAPEVPLAARGVLRTRHGRR